MQTQAWCSRGFAVVFVSFLFAMGCSGGDAPADLSAPASQPDLSNELNPDLTPAPTCNDGVKNGDETDTDCGGGTCAACVVGKSCLQASDCMSQLCEGGSCQPLPTCSDGAKNGSESDVDCGGGACPACADGLACLTPIDCASGVCTGLVCQAPACDDGVQNGSETGSDCGGPCGPCPPQDPSLVATPLKTTAATPFGNAVAFLYTGADAIQLGVAPGTIDPHRAAVLRGRVLDGNGAPLPGVQVSVHAHAEYGHTLSRTDGRFDLVVNGGGILTVDYNRSGFISAQRQVDAPWQDYAAVSDAALLRYDTQVTMVDFSAPMQVARQNMVTDADGSRQATLLFAQDTVTTMTLPDGSTQPLSTVHVRATEYTVGPMGPKAMPGPLPPSSAYTYAVELSVDEAVSAGATDVSFSKPVVSYLENFLEFPVGARVPTGYYDRQRAAWVGSDSGVVLKVLSNTGGAVDLDTDGDGNPDDPSQLATVGITDVELATIGSLYSAGQTLWRVSVSHFTPWDMNWPYGPPDDATAPDQPLDDDDDDDDDDACEGDGSIIDCQNRSLGEALPIGGSPFSLHYQSSRAPRAKAVNIHVTGAATPASLKRVDVEVMVAGRAITQSFGTLPNQSTVFHWDGMDAYGRRLFGAQPVSVRVGYVYDHVYQKSREDQIRAFAIPGTYQADYVYGRQEFTLWRSGRGSTDHVDQRPLGTGGWTLSPHHVFDPRTGTLWRGDGRRTHGFPTEVETRTPASDRPTRPGQVITTIIPGGAPYRYGANALAPDGTLYVGDYTNNYVYKVTPAGVRSTICGNGTQTNTGDGGPASAASIGRPVGIRVGSDGSLYIAAGPGLQTGANTIRRIDPQGTISTIAGGGGSLSDGVPALEEGFTGISDFVVAPDGTLFIGDSLTCRIRRIGPDGIVTTYAGSTSNCVIGPTEVPATQSTISYPNGVALGPDGSLYFTQYDATAPRVNRVTPDGILHLVAGNGTKTYVEGAQATQTGFSSAERLEVRGDGTVFVNMNYDCAIRKISPSGVLSTAIGGKCGGSPVEGGPAVNNGIPGAFSLAPDGDIFFVGGTGSVYTALRVLTSHPRASTTFVNNHLVVPSGDGRELYVLDTDYQHLKTVDALTGKDRWSFEYDGQGRVAAIVDAHGGTTTITHDSAGQPSLITGPGGAATQLSVDGNGWLQQVTRPGQAPVTLTTSADGQLGKLVDSGGGMHLFTYDTGGHLATDTQATGGVITLARANGVSTVTSPGGGVRSYSVTRAADGTTSRHVVSRNGAAADLVSRPDGTRTLSLPDGTTIDTTGGPDPRWAMAGTIDQSVTVKLPSALTQTLTSSRTTTITPGQLLDVQSMIDVTTFNGTRNFTRAYDASAHTLQLQTAAGVTSTFTLDPATAEPLGFVADTGMDAYSISYDTNGDVTGVAQGPLGITRAYDDKRRLVSQTDNASSVTTLAYDAADRVSQVTLPGGGVYGFSYDADGNRTGITRPSGGTHAFTYDARGRITSYTPPNGAALTRAYDTDGHVTTVTLGDGRTVTSSFDGTGRLTGTSFPEAQVTAAYAGTTTSLAQLTRTPTVGAPQSVSFTFDGPLVTDVTYAGPASGHYTFSYDANGVTGLKLDSGAVSPRATDGDGNLVTYGPFTFTRAAALRRTTAISDGTASFGAGWDTLGRETSRSLAVAGPRYSASVTYDAGGRLATKDESVAGVSHSYVYTYDLDGQLASVTRDGGAYEQYTYDVDGNRTGRTAAGSSQSATFDPEGRQLTHGGVAYTFDAAGFLTGRGTDTFSYSTRGELLSATVGGATVTYDYDARGRLVARTDLVGTTQFLYAGGASRVTHTRGPTGTLTEYFYDDAGRLFALQRGGVRYYVASDQVGTPRLVVDAAGTTLMTASYDAYGALLEGDPTTFDLVIGFAGGIRDPLTGLVRFGARDYEPGTGRFTARDPALFGGRQLNLYAYVANDPIDFRDPSGLSCSDDLTRQLIDKFLDQANGDPLKAFALSEQARDAKDSPELRDANHYLFTAGLSSDGVGGGLMGALIGAVTPAYSLAKLVGGESGRQLISDLTGNGGTSSPPSWAEVAWGLKGVWDGIVNRGPQKKSETNQCDVGGCD